MQEVLLVIHLILALAIIGLVLLQRSEGGGLGIGGGGGGLGGFASPQGTANVLTKMTAICAGLFFCTSLGLGILAGANSSNQSLLDALSEVPVGVEETVDNEDEPAVPAAPIAQ